MFEKLIVRACVLSAVFCGISAQVGERCILKSTRQEGECKLVSDCPVVQEQAKQGISSTICGFYELTTPIVCCEGASDASSSEDRFDFPQEENSNNNNNNVGISNRKCEEYSKIFTETFQVIPLVTNTESITFNVEKCNYNSVPLIVGGTPASASEFPFMVAIGYNSPAKWRCGGTLISDRYVLTAAHCASTRDDGRPTVVRLGDLDLSTTNDKSEHRDYTVANVIVHPGYKYPQKYNDIALIQTAQKITFTKFIRPACLQTETTIKQRLGVATGWGQTDFAADRSNRLMKVTLNFYDNQLCTTTYKQNKKELPRGIVSSMICAGELKGGMDTCPGDSGGPLLITEVGNQCKFYVVGITSFGKLCGLMNTPAVYTKVSEFIPWIEQTIW